MRASLFLFNKLWPVSAPLSLAFISPRDCRVGKTASRSCGDSIVNEALWGVAASLPRLRTSLLIYAIDGGLTLGRSTHHQGRDR